MKKVSKMADWVFTLYSKEIKKIVTKLLKMKKKHALLTMPLRSLLEGCKAGKMQHLKTAYLLATK